MANGRPKKRKKVRYSEVRIRLSYRQKRSLINYCHARKTTPNKLIKKMIRKYISNFAEDVPEEYYATENQLDLFGDGFEDEFEDKTYHEEEEQESGILIQESDFNEETTEYPDRDEEEDGKPLSLF